MKIAMPYNGGRVNEHFGQSKEFAIYTVEGGKIIDNKIINSQDLCHNHEGLAGSLVTGNIDICSCGDHEQQGQ
jgi:predicted Fe-Mo cluster-binding NifX family protein